MLRRHHRTLRELLGQYTPPLPQCSARPLLQYRRPKDTIRGTQPLRPRHRLLPMDGAVHAARAIRTCTPPWRIRLWRHRRPHPYRARSVGTHHPSANRRHQGHPHHRQGAGNTAHPLREPPLQQCVRCREDRRLIHPPRLGLGTWRRAMPDRCRRDGRPRLQIRRNIAPLLPQSGTYQMV